MKKRLGINVGPVGHVDPPRIAGSGARGIRTTYNPHISVAEGRRWMTEIRSFDLYVRLVCDNDAHFWGRPDPWADGIARAWDEYGDLWTEIQVCNEPCAGWTPEAPLSAAQRAPHHPSSWCMDPADVSSHLKTARRVLGASAVLVGPGLSSGHASWAEMVDWSPVDKIAIHPYAKQAGSPELDAMVDSYRVFGKPIVVSEYDARTPDMHAWMSADPRIDAAEVFCWSDAMVDGFGLVDVDGTPKHTYTRFAAANLDADEPEPTPPGGTMPEFKLGFKAKADELGAAVVGEPLEDQDYQVLKGGGELAYQFTTTGVMIYSKKANKVHFLAGR